MFFQNVHFGNHGLCLDLKTESGIQITRGTE